MDISRTLLLIVLALLMLEGTSLALFPGQVKQWLAEAEPWMLQTAGLCETVLAVALLAALWSG